MRLVFARCTVDYEGRLTAHLPEATRLIMVKSDGCVAIHADGGAYKPLNWMNAPNKIVEEEGIWRVSNPKGEKGPEGTVNRVANPGIALGGFLRPEIKHHNLQAQPKKEPDGKQRHLSGGNALLDGHLQGVVILLKQNSITDAPHIDSGFGSHQLVTCGVRMPS